MARTPDELRMQLEHLKAPRELPGNDERLAMALQIEATLLLVEAIDRLNAASSLTANLHEVGRPD